MLYKWYGIKMRTTVLLKVKSYDSVLIFVSKTIQELGK